MNKQYSGTYVSRRVPGRSTLSTVTFDRLRIILCFSEKYDFSNSTPMLPISSVNEFQGYEIVNSHPSHAQVNS